MSDEAVATAPKRRGRPKKLRHDPEFAPVDGNPGLDVILNKEPGFVYVEASDEDIPTIQGRGGVVCDRESEQARPYHDVRKNAGESHFNIRGLTLMKIPQDLYDRHQKAGEIRSVQRMTALKRNATAQLGNGQFASISNHEGGYVRSIQ